MPFNTVVATDNFSRTVASGWGSADTNQVWLTSGGNASDYSVNGVAGLHSLGSINVSRRTAMDIAIADVSISGSIVVPVLATGAAIGGGYMARHVDSDNYYLGEVQFNTDQTIQVRLRKNVAGTLTTLQTSANIPGLVHTTGGVYRLRFEVEGNTLRARVWDNTVSEPAIWHAEIVDTDFTTASQIGVRSVLGVGNTNTLPFAIRYDNLTVLKSTSQSIGVVAAYNQSYHSPGFDITVNGLGGMNTLTIDRIDLTGSLPDTPVRGADHTAISSGSFGVSDYEAPVGRAVAYRATATTNFLNDLFNRTVVSGWGYSSFGLPWMNEGGSSSVYSVNNEAKMSIDANGVSRRTFLGGVDVADVNLTCDIRVPVAPAGGNVQAGLMARYKDGSNYYFVELMFNPDATIDMRMQRVAGGTFTQLGITTIPFVHSTGAFFRLRFNVQGTRIRAKAWNIGVAEPAAWDIDVTDVVLSSGTIGCRGALGPANSNTKPVDIIFDGFTATVLGDQPLVSLVGTSSATGLLDTFSRTVSGGWGSPDLGSAYAILNAPPADYSVASGVARMSMSTRSGTSTNPFGTEYVMGSPLTAHRDVDQTVRVRSRFMPANDVIRVSMLARTIDTQNFCELELSMNASGAMGLRIGREVGGGGSYTSSTVAPTTFAVDQWYWLRFQVIGNTYRGKVWADGTSEPAGWLIERTDATFPTGNYVGLKALSSSFRTDPLPSVIEWDDYTVALLNADTLIPYTDPGVTWLKSVGQPALSRRVNLSQWSETTQPGRVLGEYEVLGRRNKVVLRDVLGGREGTFVLATYKMGAVWENDSSYRDVTTLLELGNTMLLQTTGVDNTGEDDMFIEITSVKKTRIGVVGGDFAHLFEISFIEVDRPDTSQESLTLRSWQDVMDQNSSWQDVIDSHPTWLDVLQRNL